MEFTQKQSPVQGLRQEQIMTHHQIQALEMLSTPVLELESMINEELEKNPVLDAETEEPVTPSTRDDDEDWLEGVMKLDEDSRYIRSQSYYVSPEEEDRRRHYLESLEAKKTLHENLIEQLRFLELQPAVYNCCEVVISGLDDEGYLSSHPADLAMVAGEALEAVSEAIEIIKRLEPAGVGAKNLQERLLIQLEARGRQESTAYRAVKNFLKEIANNQLPAVSRKMGISITELNEVLDEIKSLNPRLECDDVMPNDYIKEEVEVIEDNGEFVVRVINDYLPSLHISRHYKQLLSDPKTSKEVRTYVKEKIRTGVHFINSIIQRQTTIYKTVNAVVQEQQDFFTYGVKHLKPLTMSRIADIVGVHETTISRAVAGKYLRCKHGLFALRQFFSTGYTVRDGSTVSNTVVKNAISRLVENENAYAPFSDSEIAAKLKLRGLDVARRTVAKYRESLGILPSNLRRKYQAVSQ